jgi:hypothetical protein
MLVGISISIFISSAKYNKISLVNFTNLITYLNPPYYKFPPWNEECHLWYEKHPEDYPWKEKG